MNVIALGGSPSAASLSFHYIAVNNYSVALPTLGYSTWCVSGAEKTQVTQF